MKKITLILGILITGFQQLSGQPGSLDNSFKAGYCIDSYVNSVAIQPDGKIIIGGNFLYYSNHGLNFITRLNNDGTIDHSFKTVDYFYNNIFDIEILPDGKILVVGDFNMYNGREYKLAVRLNNDGTIDTTFKINADAIYEGDVGCMAIQSDGKVILGGYFRYLHNSKTIEGIVRYNKDGSIDDSFDIGVGFKYGFVETIKVLAEDKLMVGGRIFEYNGSNCKRLVRLNKNGVLDSSFNFEMDSLDYINLINFQQDGKIIVAGGTWGAGFFGRFNEDGSLDLNFKSEVNADFISTFCIQPDGKIVLGRFYSATNIIRLYKDGSVDPSFITAKKISEMIIYSLLVQPDGKILGNGYDDNVWRNFRLHGDSTSNSIESLVASPNPSNGIFTIELPGEIDELAVTDVLGKIILKNQFPGNLEIIDLTKNSPGLYFIKVRRGNESKVIRVLKH